MTNKLSAIPPSALVGELRALIEQARGRVAQAINSELIWLHWQIGTRLRTELLGEERATYGEQLVDAVAASLTAQYGRGFSKRNLHYMIRFAEVFADAEIVHAVRAQLSWTHLRELLAIDDPLIEHARARAFDLASKSGNQA